MDELLRGWLGGDKPITILDLSGVPSNVLERLVGSILKVIYEALFWSREKAEGGIERPLLIVMEEAHRYLADRSGGTAIGIVQRNCKRRAKVRCGCDGCQSAAFRGGRDCFIAVWYVLSPSGYPIQTTALGCEERSQTGLLASLMSCRFFAPGRPSSPARRRSCRCAVVSRFRLKNIGQVAEIRKVSKKWRLPRREEGYRRVVASWRIPKPDPGYRGLGDTASSGPKTNRPESRRRTWKSSVFRRRR